MSRWLGCSVAIVALLAFSYVIAQERGDPQGNKAGGKRVEGEGPGAPLEFNYQQFLKDFDKNQDGQLSRDELPASLRHNFDQLDTDKNGRLSPEELKRGVVYLQQRRRPSDVVFVLIEMSDCDEGCTEEVQRAYDVLRALDKDRDGKISAAELKASREQLVRERIGGLIKDLDANGDGRLSREEARGMIRQDFDRLDANRDGFIDRDELMRGALARAAGADGTAPRKQQPDERQPR